VNDCRRKPEGPIRWQERELQLQERQRSRESVRLLGLLAILVFVLVLAFIRFGKHIPWGAR
jgi:hypothetical protein